MQEPFKARLDQAKQIFSRRWVRVALGVWAVICFYDTAGSQFLPPSWQSKRPTVYTGVEMTTGLLPFWLWLVVGALIAAAASFEYAHRVSRRVGAEPPPVLAAEVGDEWVPLTEAARQAYEKTRGSPVTRMLDHMSRDEADAEADVLTSFAGHVKEYAAIYGSMPPSQTIERADLTNCVFAIEQGELIAREIYGPRRWVNLAVKAPDLTKGLEAMLNKPGFRPGDVI
jgi:hypothetical protein